MKRVLIDGNLNTNRVAIVVDVCDHFSAEPQPEQTIGRHIALHYTER